MGLPCKAGGTNLFHAVDEGIVDVEQRAVAED